MGRTSPISILTAVVFPAPLGPRKPKTSPRGTARVRSSTATLLPELLPEMGGLNRQLCLDHSVDHTHAQDDNHRRHEERRRVHSAGVQSLGVRVPW